MKFNSKSIATYKKRTDRIKKHNNFFNLILQNKEKEKRKDSPNGASM